MAGPSTSTVRPQSRHTRWWWWPAHRAAPVGGFAVVGSDQVKLAGVGHHQQGSVDGRQPDVLTLVAEVVVDLAGGAEVVSAGQQVGDCGALPRVPLRGG